MSPHQKSTIFNVNWLPFFIFLIVSTQTALSSYHPYDGPYDRSPVPMSYSKHPNRIIKDEQSTWCLNGFRLSPCHTISLNPGHQLPLKMNKPNYHGLHRHGLFRSGLPMHHPEESAPVHYYQRPGHRGQFYKHKLPVKINGPHENYAPNDLTWAPSQGSGLYQSAMGFSRRIVKMVPHMGAKFLSPFIPSFKFMTKSRLYMDEHGHPGHNQFEPYPTSRH